MNYPDISEKQFLEADIYWTGICHSVNEQGDWVYYILTHYQKTNQSYEVVRRFGVRFLDNSLEKQDFDFIIEKVRALAYMAETNIPKDIEWHGPYWQDEDFF